MAGTEQEEYLQGIARVIGLVRALFETGFANKPLSIPRDDGLILKDAYLTAAVRCAPPLNKPDPSEMSNCFQYLMAETKLREKTTKVILALGKIAFDAYCKVCNVKGLCLVIIRYIPSLMARL